MRPRTLTIGSFFSVAMAATLVGALVTSQVRRPEAGGGQHRGHARGAARAELAVRASRPSATSPARSMRASSTSTPRRRCACPAIATRSATSSACRRTTSGSAPRSRERPRRRAPHPHEPRLGLRDRRPGLHPDQPPRDRGRRRDQRDLPGRQALRREGRRPGRAHRRRADQDRAEGAADADPARRLRRASRSASG